MPGRARSFSPRAWISGQGSSVKLAVIASVEETGRRTIDSSPSELIEIGRRTVGHCQTSDFSSMRYMVSITSLSASWRVAMRSLVR